MEGVKRIIYSILLGILSFIIFSNIFNTQHCILISIITFLICLWTNQGLPLGVVCLLPIILFPSLDIISVNDTVQNYSKSIIFLFLGGFMISIATEKLNLHKIISNKILSIFPNNAMGIIMGLSISAAALSSLISNTTACLILFPIATFLTDNKLLKTRLILVIAYASSIGGIMTPIGTPPNLIFMGLLEDSNIVENISFVKWIVLTVPLALVFLIFMAIIMSTGVREIKIKRNVISNPSLNYDQKKLVFILISLIILLVINSPIKPYYSGLGLNEKLILLGYGILMFIPKIGCLTWEDTRKIPYEIIFLLGAGLSIATAFSKTGLTQEIAGMLSVINDMPLILIIIIIAASITFTTEITSNTALTSLSLPIIYSILADNNDVNTRLILFIATIASSYSFMLPIATMPNAIAMSYKVVRVKDMIKFGFILNLTGIIMITIVSYLFWQFYL